MLFMSAEWSFPILLIIKMELQEKPKKENQLMASKKQKIHLIIIISQEKQTPPQNVTEVEDVAYIDDGNVYHKLDVMYPDNLKSGEKLPVIIDIHGGGWMYADKDLNDNYCLSLADRGYVVFNISYRLVPDVTVNEQIQDVAYALKWIGENMKNYPCDTANIMLTGDSAGGQLAAYSAVIMQSEELQRTFNTIDPKIEITTLLLTSPVAFMKTAGAFSLYTKPMWGTDYKEKQTYQYMDFDEIIGFAEKMPDTYLITSSGDTLAQKQTNRMYQTLKSHGVKCEIADYGTEYGKKLKHVFSVLEPFDKAGSEAIDKAVAFYRESIASKQTV
jgi:acetyl esterase